MEDNTVGTIKDQLSSLEDRSSHQGEIKDDQQTNKNDNSKSVKEGFGIDNLNNLWKYEGYYKNGKRHGQGKLWCRNKLVFEGEFEEGQIRNGTRFGRKEKRAYKGSFKNNKKHGFGIEYHPKSGAKIFEGIFENGQRSEGIDYSNGRTEGIWKNGKLLQIQHKHFSDHTEHIFYNKQNKMIKREKVFPNGSKFRWKHDIYWRGKKFENNEYMYGMFRENKKHHMHPQGPLMAAQSPAGRILIRVYSDCLERQKLLEDWTTKDLLQWIDSNLGDHGTSIYQKVLGLFYQTNGAPIYKLKRLCSENKWDGKVLMKAENEFDLEAMGVPAQFSSQIFDVIKNGKSDHILWNQIAVDFPELCGVPWEVKRLLWIAVLKNQKEWCAMAMLPLDVLKYLTDNHLKYFLISQ